MDPQICSIAKDLESLTLSKVLRWVKSALVDRDETQNVRISGGCFPSKQSSLVKQVPGGSAGGTGG